MSAFAINFIAVCFIFIWASWCVVYHGVKDGIVGKLLFACVAISALAIIIHSLTGHYGSRPFITMNVCIAMVGMRHVFLTWRKQHCAEMRKENDAKKYQR